MTDTPADPRSRLRLRLTAAVCFLGLVLAGAADAGDAAPWAEKGLSGHIDFSSLEGTLSAAGLDKLIGEGKHIFTARFTTADGLGRPMATQAIIPTRRKHPVDVMFRRTAGLDFEQLPELSQCAGSRRRR